ncbi:hypothetical protein FRC05_002905 [Tulasnella sp. 425]|nr:hypothetical protein FRC05_002905 [Tulasnella sp. 425]
MPTPATHYRIALGEHSGEHSWIIHSAKGIKWHNIPDELVTLLQKVAIDELLDYSLGSDGRWCVRYRLKGAERHELSPYLWMDLNQGAKVKLDRLTLGPDADHWGVYRASDGSFQTFSSVGTRDKLTRLLGWKTDKIESSNQIGFVALGFAGDWAFSVNGQAKYRCSKPFQKEFSDGLKAQKRVSTVVLSSMARLWIIVWEDGTLSHNLPSKLAGQVKVYCQLKHSLKVNGIQSNSGRPKAPKVKPPRNIPRAPTTPPQKQQPTPQDTITGDTPGSSENTTQPLARDVSPTTNQQRNTASAFGSQTLPAPPPGEATADTVPVPKAPIPSVFCSSQQSVTGPLPAQPPTVPHISKAPAVTQLATQVPRTSSRPQQTPWILSSQADRAISRVETIFGKPLIYGPTKKLSTTLRQLDPTDWNDSYEYNKRRLESSV